MWWNKGGCADWCRVEKIECKMDSNWVERPVGRSSPGLRHGLPWAWGSHEEKVSLPGQHQLQGRYLFNIFVWTFLGASGSSWWHRPLKSSSLVSVSKAATSWDGEIAAATAAAASDRGGRRSCANPGLVYWGRGQRSRSGGRGRQRGFPGGATHIPGYKRPSQQHWTIRTRVKVCFVSINICRKQWPPKSVTFCFGRYCKRQIGSVFCVVVRLLTSFGPYPSLSPWVCVFSQ